MSFLIFCSEAFVKNIFYWLVVGSNIFFCSNYCCDIPEGKKPPINPRILRLIAEEIFVDKTFLASPVVKKEVRPPKKAIEHAKEQAPWVANPGSRESKKVVVILAVLVESSGKEEDEEEK